MLNRFTASTEALWKAYHHYNAEVKEGKAYAKPIADGLMQSIILVREYNYTCSQLRALCPGLEIITSLTKEDSK